MIVAGGGNAGMCAALSAAEQGARVLVAERSPFWRRGGNSRHTRDLRYTHIHPDRYAPIPYPRDAFLADLESVADTIPRPDLADLLVEESEALPGWMSSHGVRWQAPIRGALHLGTNLFFLGGGKAMMNTYYDRCEALGIEVRYGTSVTSIETANGRCTGAELASGDLHETVEAGAIVVASGGLEANHAWLAEQWGAGAANFIIRGTPDNDGDLLLSLLERDATPVGSNLFHCVAVDARSPRFDGGIVTRVDSIPFGIAVNAKGMRFQDEGAAEWPKRYAEWGQLIAAQDDQTAYSIFDTKANGLFILPPYPAVRSDTVAGLADLLGLPVDAVTNTVETFNASIDETKVFDPSRLDGRGTRGLDPPKSNWARALDAPPFSAYPLRPGLTFTYAGVEIDASGRIQRRRAAAFENVFAAGEVMAGNILTRGYLAGVGLTIGGVFGRIAGREAAHA